MLRLSLLAPSLFLRLLPLSPLLFLLDSKLLLGHLISSSLEIVVMSSFLLFNSQSNYIAVLEQIRDLSQVYLGCRGLHLHFVLFPTLFNKDFVRVKPLPFKGVGDILSDAYFLILLQTHMLFTRGQEVGDGRQLFFWEGELELTFFSISLICKISLAN